MASIDAPRLSPSVSPDEARFFGDLAADWWNPEGSSAMLHRITPLRSRLVRDAAVARFGRDARSRTPLMGLTALDIGCGAGLLTEPLARMAAVTTGIDAAPENIAAAIAHAAEAVDAGDLAITYRASSVEAMAAEAHKFDIITCLEVIEHVADRDSFFAGLATLLAPDGIAILSTPNRTAASWAVLIGGAEILLRRIPRGAHDWQRFMTPAEVGDALSAVGLIVTETHGLGWRPGSGFGLGSDTRINYFLTVVRG